MKRARLSTLHAVAKQRGGGYLEACLKAGKISRDGQWIIFDAAAHAQIRRQYNPHKTISLSARSGERARAQSAAGEVAPRRKIGLGDAIHKIAGPIAKAIRWPCLKSDGTTDLKPDSLCARTRARLNKVKV